MYSIKTRNGYNQDVTVGPFKTQEEASKYSTDNHYKFSEIVKIPRAKPRYYVRYITKDRFIKFLPKVYESRALAEAALVGSGIHDFMIVTHTQYVRKFANGAK